MAKYSLANTMAGTQQAFTTTYKTLWDLTAATGATTLRRAWIYDVEFSCDAAPGDNTVIWKVDLQTTTGTRTAATPAKLDQADAAALITAGVNSTAEPTVTSATQLLEQALNQRSAYRWTTLPGSGGEMIVPATNTTGLGGRGKGLSSGYTGTGIGKIHFFE